MRATLAGLLAIVVLCGGGLYALNATLGRDAQMRAAERDFYIANQDTIEAHKARMRAEYEANRALEWGEDDLAGGEEVSSLDDWYAEAGSNDGPVDVTPEDKSHLINDAEPFSDGEPIL